MSLSCYFLDPLALLIHNHASSAVSRRRLSSAEMLKQAFHSYEMWNISEEWDCLENSHQPCQDFLYNCILSKILPPNLLSLPLFEGPELHNGLTAVPGYPAFSSFSLYRHSVKNLKVLGFLSLLTSLQLCLPTFHGCWQKTRYSWVKDKGECLAHSYGTNENISIYPTYPKPQTQQNDIKRVKWQP